MYKYLLCWRYLRTRYLAFVCVVSVMLGVTTLIVVNGVMNGFTTKLRDRLHGVSSDVVIESIEFEGFADPDALMRHIRHSPIGRHVAAIAPTIEVFAMLQFPVRGTTITKPVKLIGVDAEAHAAVGGFGEYLRDRQGQRVEASFAVSPEAMRRFERNRSAAPPDPLMPEMLHPNEPPPPEAWDRKPPPPRGIIVGQMVAAYRERRPDGGVELKYLLDPGDSVTITTVSGAKLAPVFDHFIVCNYFRSDMSEYDSNFVFVPLDHLQQVRAMPNRATALHLRLTDFAHAPEVVAELRKMLPAFLFTVRTWEEMQGPLLSAIAIERGILNVLLFLIIGVAGFGILAIFSMIVVEKTRDIGILKALGASNGGVLTIFLAYGLLLGLIGASLGTALGLWIAFNLNDVEAFLSRLTGHQVFDRGVYYFDSIPVDVRPEMVLIVNLGALAIAVAFSVLPAMRAALLQPVRALRYE